MKIIFDIRNEENNKVIFECKEEQDAFFEEKCPRNFSLMGDKPCRNYDGNMEDCIRCWNAAVECEVAEPKAIIELKSIPTTCYECPCFGHESGICQITGQLYEDTKLECPIKEC